MRKEITVSDIPLPTNVSLISSTWYISVDKDFTVETLPTEIKTTDLLTKVFEYPYEIDTIIYVKCILKGSDGREHPTDILLTTKDRDSLLVDKFIYPPIVNTHLDKELTTLHVTISEPIFFFKTAELLAVSWRISDTSGNVLYYRPYDIKNKSNISIPIQNLIDESSLVVEARYEFDGVIDDVWGKKTIVFNTQKLDIVLDKETINSLDDNELMIMINPYAIGNLIYSIETVSGKVLLNDKPYLSKIVVPISVIEAYTKIAIRIKLINSIYGLLEKTFIIKIDNSVEVVQRVMSNNPDILLLGGMISTEAKELTIMNNILFNISKLSTVISSFNISTNYISLINDNIIDMFDFVSDLSIKYVNDKQLLITYNNNTNLQLHLVNINNGNLTITNTFTLPLNTKVTLIRDNLYYISGIFIITMNIKTSSTTKVIFNTTLVGDLSVFPIGSSYIIINEVGEYMSLMDNSYKLLNGDIRELFCYPTYDGVIILKVLNSNIIYSTNDVVDDNTFLYFIGSEEILELGSFRVKDINITPMYDLKNDRILIMEG